MCRFCDIFGERCLQHRRSHWQLGQGKERREWAQVLSNNGTKSSPHRPSRWQGPCRKAPAAAPKRDSTSLGARLEGGPIKKHIERYRNAKDLDNPPGAAPLPTFNPFPDICCVKAKVHRPTANVIWPTPQQRQCDHLCQRICTEKQTLNRQHMQMSWHVLARASWCRAKFGRVVREREHEGGVYNRSLYVYIYIYYT